MAGANSIFNVIVDSDDTAAKLMDLLERRKLGRVTFMPLNTLARRMSPRKELKEKVVAYLIDVSWLVVPPAARAVPRRPAPSRSVPCRAVEETGKGDAGCGVRPVLYPGLSALQGLPKPQPERCALCNP